MRKLLELRENDAICVRYGMLSAEEVRELKTKVALVSTWGINDDERLARVLEWGLDAIITDEVSIMRKIAAIRTEKSAARKLTDHTGHSKWMSFGSNSNSSGSGFAMSVEPRPW